MNSLANQNTQSALEAKTSLLANLPIEVLQDILDHPDLDDDVSYLSLAFTSSWLYPHAIKRWDASRAWARVRSSFFNITEIHWHRANELKHLTCFELPGVGKIKYACPTPYFPAGPLLFAWDGTEKSLPHLPAVEVEGLPMHLRLRPQHTLIGDLITQVRNWNRTDPNDRLTPAAAVRIVEWLMRQGANPDQVACNRCLLSNFRTGPVEEEVRISEWMKTVGNSAHTPMTQLSYILEYSWQAQDTCMAVMVSLLKHGARFPPTVPYPKCSNVGCARRLHPFYTNVECHCSHLDDSRKGMADGEPVSTLRLAISAPCPALYLRLALHYIPKAEQGRSLFTGNGGQTSWYELFVDSLNWEWQEQFRDQVFPIHGELDRGYGLVPRKNRQKQVIVRAAKKLALLERSGIIGSQEMDFIYGNLRAGLMDGRRERPPPKRFYQVFGENGWGAWEKNYAEDVDLFWRKKYGIAEEEGLAVPLVSATCGVGTVRAHYAKLAKGIE